MERFAMDACLAGDLVTRLAGMLHGMGQGSRQNLLAQIGIVHRNLRFEVIVDSKTYRASKL